MYVAGNSETKSWSVDLRSLQFSGRINANRQIKCTTKMTKMEAYSQGAIKAQERAAQELLGEWRLHQRGNSGDVSSEE